METTTIDTLQAQRGELALRARDDASAAKELEKVEAALRAERLRLEREVAAVAAAVRLEEQRRQEAARKATAEAREALREVMTTRVSLAQRLDNALAEAERILGELVETLPKVRTSARGAGLERHSLERRCSEATTNAVLARFQSLAPTIAAPIPKLARPAADLERKLAASVGLKVEDSRDA